MSPLFDGWAALPRSLDRDDFRLLPAVRAYLSTGRSIEGGLTGVRSLRDRRLLGGLSTADAVLLTLLTLRPRAWPTRSNRAPVLSGSARGCWPGNPCGKAATVVALFAVATTVLYDPRALDRAASLTGATIEVRLVPRVHSSGLGGMSITWRLCRRR